MEEVWGYNEKGFAICGPIQDMVLRLFFLTYPSALFFFKSPMLCFAVFADTWALENNGLQESLCMGFSKILEQVQLCLLNIYIYRQAVSNFD